MDGVYNHGNCNEVKHTNHTERKEPKKINNFEIQFTETRIHHFEHCDKVITTIINLWNTPITPKFLMNFEVSLPHFLPLKTSGSFVCSGISHVELFSLHCLYLLCSEWLFWVTFLLLHVSVVFCFVLFCFFFVLARLGLSCGTKDIGSLVATYGIQFPDQGSNLGILHWESGVLATGQSGNSLLIGFCLPISKYYWVLSIYYALFIHLPLGGR